MSFSSLDCIESNNCPSSRPLPHRRTCLPYTGGGESTRVGHVVRFHFRFHYRTLINLFIFNQTQQAVRLEYEGTGVLGGDRDEWGKLGQEGRETGTGGGKSTGVGHVIRFHFRFHYRTLISLFIFDQT